MKRKKGIALLVTIGILVGMCACGTGKVKEAEISATEENISEESGVTEAEENSYGAEESDIMTEESASAQTEEIAETGQIISISMAEMKEKLEAKEDFLVSFVTIDCPYCQEFHRILVDYIQEHIVTMYQVILDYEELPEEENRRIIKDYFQEFNTVPGTFYVENGENASYLDMYQLGVSMEVFDHWIQELGIEEK